MDKEFQSKYFKRKEFACKCGCGFDTVDAKLLEVLDQFRQAFDEPITITSGCRCPAYNESVGGAPNSRHLEGKAADFKVKGYKPEEVFGAFDACMEGWGGLGLYSSWVHVDVRDEKARWGH